MIFRQFYFYDDWKEYYRKLIYYDIKKLNTPKVQNIQQLFKNYFGISENEIDEYGISI